MGVCKLISVFVVLTLSQGCVFHEKKIDILYVEPKHIAPSYFGDNPEYWPDVSTGWWKEHDFLGFEVITHEQTNIHRSYDIDPPVMLFVNDCSKEIPIIYQPGSRFLERTPAGNFKYETVIEYRRRPGGAEHSYYDLFEKPAELCFYIQTLEMPFVSRGDTYRLQLSEDIKRLAEGE